MSDSVPDFMCFSTKYRDSTECTGRYSQRTTVHTKNHKENHIIWAGGYKDLKQKYNNELKIFWFVLSKGLYSRTVGYSFWGLNDIAWNGNTLE